MKVDKFYVAFNKSSPLSMLIYYNGHCSNRSYEDIKYNCDKETVMCPPVMCVKKKAIR